MKTLGKLVGILLLTVILLLSAAAVYITRFLDPNDYKEEIQQLVLDKTELQLEIGGDIGWSLFPWLGLELSDTQLAYNGQASFAHIDRLGLSVRALPLLQKDIRMSGIRLDGLQLDLQVDKDGQANWQPPASTGAQKDSSSSASPAPESSPPPTKANNSQPLQLDIASLSLSNASVQYQNLRNQQQFSLDNIQLETGAISPGQDFKIKLSGFLASNSPLLRAKAQLTGNAFFDESQQHIRLGAFSLDSELAGDPLANKSAHIRLDGNLDLDLVQQQLKLAGLKLQFNQLQALAELELGLSQPGPSLNGRISIAPLELRSFLTGLGIELPADLPAGALSKLELTGQLAGSLDSPRLQDAQIQLDQSRLTGQLGYLSQQQALQLKLKADQFNLDHYQSASTPAAAGKKTNNSAAKASSKPAPAAKQSGNSPWSSEPMLPLASLVDLNLDAQLDVEQLVLSGLPLQQTQLKAKARNGKIDIQNFNAALYGGQIAANASINARQTRPAIQLKANIKQLPIERVARQLGEPLPISGNLQLNTQLTTQGNSELEWVNNLAGQLNLQLLDGVLQESNLEQQLCMGIAVLNRKSLTQSKKATSTPFTRLATSARIQKGQAHTPDLRIAIPGLLVKGKGDLNLNQMSLDYRLGVVLEGDTRAMPDPACTINKRYVGLEVPVRCQGRLDQLEDSCSIDQDGVSKLVSRLAGERLTEKLEEKLQDKLKDRVSPDLKDALKGLFRK